MDLLSDVVSRLVSIDPRKQAAEVLNVVVQRLRAAGGAVLVAESGEVFAAQGITVTQLGQAQKAMKAQTKALRAGKVVSAGPLQLVPLLDAEARKGDVLGVLCLHVEAADWGDLRLIRAALAQAIKSEGSGEAPLSIPEYLARTPVRELQKQQLLETLQQNEWNIQRTARLLGVTRRTIYLRLGRYGIKRLKVPKTLRPFSLLPKKT